MTDLDQLAHRVANAAVQLTRDDDELGRQILRESMGIDNTCKVAYNNRRKSRGELRAIVQEYIEALESPG